MSRPLPWDDIRVPVADYNVRLIPNGGTIPCYWGRDPEGNCLLLISLDGDHRKLFAENRVTVNGIDVDLRADPATGRHNLVLTLERQIDGDLFFSLCGSLVESLISVARGDTALNVALTHIKRWKAFLAGRNPRRLSPEEIRGLFAELTFLLQVMTEKSNELLAVSAWTGADSIQQDFVFADCAVEVKSVSGTDRNTIRISSEDQLDSIFDDLFLVAFRLGEAIDSDRASSLNALVKRIEDGLSEADAIEEFSRKLGAYGYTPLPEYDKPDFIVTGSDAFRILEGFPRIVRSGLPEGVSRVKYQIEMEHLAPFRCALKDVLGEV
jgi:hypothetical protein